MLDFDPASFVRLQKYIADHGIASRRAAEKLIAEGYVKVNGETITEMGFKILPGKDAVKVKGKLLHTKDNPVYIMLNKPIGVLTTMSDPEGRETVKDLLGNFKKRVFPVGRLDYDSEGLLLLTNDGAFSQNITHPEKHVRKVYQVKIKDKLKPEQIQKLKKGVTLREGKTRFANISKLKTGANYDWYSVTLTEGKNRQIRRMFEKVGTDVLKLKRVSVGRLRLGSLPKGQYRFLTPSEIQRALSQ